MSHEAQMGFFDIDYFNNLLGDQLLDYGNTYMPTGILPQQYFENTYEHIERDRQNLFRTGMLLHSLLLKIKTSWLEVIPYNENLVFLKGENGAYDFVFRGMRNQPYNHNPYAPYLKNDDIPKTQDEYDFQRWLYFPRNGKNDPRNPYTGWLEKDRHDAEINYYEKGGLVRSYPNQDTILKSLFSNSGRYQQFIKTAKSSKGFNDIEIDGQQFAISDLITIGEFKSFMSDNIEYEEYSRLADGVDDWTTVNEDDDDLPAFSHMVRCNGLYRLGKQAAEVACQVAERERIS
ncbi:MAG: hypothetical protein ACNI26_13430 [Terasakiella sp.]|uniref:hypothetical protein n=1 Tax=unclassified Terasakiella TaxID=2614952 RepID=UPI003B00A4FE